MRVWLFFVLVVGVVLALAPLAYLDIPPLIEQLFQDKSRGSISVSILSPSPTPYRFVRYTIPTIEPKSSYAIFLVGDSMTQALGPYPYQLSLRMNAAYPTQRFIIDNYSQGAKNVLSLFELLTTPITLDGKDEPAALERNFDVLIIESFGHNPLSHLPLEEGFTKQEETLTEVITRVTRDHPQSLVVFLTTLAPSPQAFGDGLLNLPPELKQGYVRERQAYIENHIRYAREHSIPLLDLYEESKNPDGTVKLEYTRVDDHIHPSQAGVEWIQHRIADFLIENTFLPHE